MSQQNSDLKAMCRAAAEAQRGMSNEVARAVQEKNADQQRATQALPQYMTSTPTSNTSPTPGDNGHAWRGRGSQEANRGHAGVALSIVPIGGITIGDTPVGDCAATSHAPGAESRASGVVTRLRPGSGAGLGLG